MVVSDLKGGDDSIYGLEGFCLYNLVSPKPKSRA